MLGDLSCREVARLAGVAQGSVSLIERADQNVESRELTTKTLSRIARVFGVTLDWLYLGRGKRPSNKGVRAAVTRAKSRADEAAAALTKGRSKSRVQSGHGPKMKAHTAERNGRAVD